MCTTIINYRYTYLITFCSKCKFVEIIDLDIAYESKRRKMFVFYFLSGLCTEFNVDGGVIHIHRTTPCGNEKFPSCSETYKSSEAYKCKKFKMSLFKGLLSFTYNLINVYMYNNIHY